MIKKILFGALLLVTGSLWAENPNLDYPTDTIEGVVIYRYPVDRSIGLYRVSVNFAVSQATIIEWNPFLKERGLQFGDTLYIPTGRPIVEARPEEKEAIEAIDTIAAIEAIDTIDTIGVIRMPTDTFKLALLLPLQAKNEQRTEAMDRFVDFYEGCLLALKDMQDSTKIELYIYDTDKDLAKLSQLMEKELEPMNAIIGPAYPQQVAAIDTFVNRHHIPTMIPFTNEVASLNDNPYLYLFNTTSQMDVDTFVTYLEKRGELTNCVLVEGKDENIHKDIRILRDRIEEKGLPHTQTTLHQILADSIFMALKEDVENIVILNSTNFANIQILLPHLTDGKTDRRVSLYSQFAWQKERIIIPQVYTTIFATDSVPALADYEADYTLYFGHRHASLTPRYDLLGYDITRQFLSTLMGKEPQRGLQSDIRFTRVGEGGYVNTHIMLIHK